MITIHQRHRRTDRQTTCDGNTALCTKVHRAVIKPTRHDTPQRRHQPSVLLHNSHWARHSKPSCKTRMSLLQRYLFKFKYPVNPVGLHCCPLLACLLTSLLAYVSTLCPRLVRDHRWVIDRWGIVLVTLLPQL